MVSNELLTAIVAVLGGGGIVSSLAVLVRMRPEANRIVVDAAEGAVVVQASVIKDLREEVANLRTELRKERLDCAQEIAALRRLITTIDERQQTRREGT